MRFDFAVVQQAGIADGSQLHVVRLLTLYPKAALCYRSMPIPSHLQVLKLANGTDNGGFRSTRAPEQQQYDWSVDLGAHLLLYANLGPIFRSSVCLH